MAWWLDRNEREPLRLLATAFLWGAVPAVGFVLLANLQLGPVEGALGALLVAPVLEEWAKSIGVKHVADAHRHEFDGLLDGLIYGSVVGFGFGMTEDILYLVMAHVEGGNEAWIGTAIARDLVFITGHAAYTSCYGAALGLARYAQGERTRRWAPRIGLAAAITLHFLHNLLTGGTAGDTVLLAVALAWSVNLAWLGLVVWAVAAEGRWIRQELRAEAKEGTLPKSIARSAGSYTARLNALRRARFRGAEHQRLVNELHTAAVELALARRRERIAGDGSGLSSLLRDRCREISRALGANAGAARETKPARSSVNPG